MKLKKNVGITDRILRLGAGLVMIYFGFVDNAVVPDQVAAVILGVFGSIILLTGVFSVCPLYNFIGANTCNKQDDS